MSIKIENTPSPSVLMNSMRSIGYTFKTALADSDRMKLRHKHSERSKQTMSEKIVQLNEEVIKSLLRLMWRSWCGEYTPF